MSLLIDTTSGDYDYTYISLGAGVQSSALLVLSCLDDRVPKADAAVFADTGDEPSWVYEYVTTLTDWAKLHGMTVHTATAGRLSDRMVGRSMVPFFTDGGTKSPGMLLRKCTSEHKINPIEKCVRTLLGYQPRQWVRENVRAMLGITIDESQRMKPSRTKWLTNSYPLVDLGLSRNDCYKIMEDAGLPKPEKSACIYCPYHSDTYWSFLKTQHPTEFQEAVRIDHKIRDLSAAGVKNLTYVHRSCVPLDQVEFKAGDPNQVDMFNNECEGMCGI